MISLKWIAYLLGAGFIIWVLFAIRLGFAIKKRKDKQDSETFEKRDN